MRLASHVLGGKVKSVHGLILGGAIVKMYIFPLISYDRMDCVITLWHL